MNRHRAVLALEDGSLFRGTAFGALGRVSGEVVFNTAMSGYQEVLTDPSYWGQLVVMTAPQIGNTGVNFEDPESSRAHVRGFLAREFCRLPSNHRSTLSLDAYMKDQNVVGIHGIDTRALTRLIREKGCLRGVLVSGPGVELPSAEPELVRAARTVTDLATLDPVREVTSPRHFEWHGEPNRDPDPRSDRVGGPTLAVLDCGMKWNILRQLHASGARLVVFPATATADEILELSPDGLFLTNGPGDPRTTSYAVATVRELLGRLPMRGICLGHQLLALAVGADTHKLKFGHHGVNHPVQNLATGTIEITSQNHNYAVDEDTAKRHGFEITHRNLFDGTVEGMRHDDLDLFSVQYHPEAAPGPHDSAYLWDEFLEPLSEAS